MRFFILSLMITVATQLEAKNMIDHSDWSYLADTVMGGVPTGEARIENRDKGRTIHLKGWKVLGCWSKAMRIPTMSI